MLSGGRGEDGDRSELAKSLSTHQGALYPLEKASKGATVENSAEVLNTTKIGSLKNFWEKKCDQNDVTRPNFCAANGRGKFRQNFGLSNQKILPKLED